MSSEGISLRKTHLRRVISEAFLLKGLATVLLVATNRLAWAETTATGAIAASMSVRVEGGTRAGMIVVGSGILVERAWHMQHSMWHIQHSNPQLPR